MFKNMFWKCWKKISQHLVNTCWLNDRSKSAISWKLAFLAYFEGFPRNFTRYMRYVWWNCKIYHIYIWWCEFFTTNNFGHQMLCGCTDNSFLNSEQKDLWTQINVFEIILIIWRNVFTNERVFQRFQQLLNNIRVNLIIGNWNSCRRRRKYLLRHCNRWL